jgi:hypothetical protein
VTYQRIEGCRRYPPGFAQAFEIVSGFN